MKTLFLLSIPAIVFILISKAGATPKLPRWVRMLFLWFGYVGNITLALYCGLVTFYAIYGLLYADQAVEVVLQLVMAGLMSLLGGSFWRTAQRQMRRS